MVSGVFCSSLSNIDTLSDSNILDDPELYRKIVGSLIYVMTCTRPDICYSVTMLSQFLTKPTKAHLEWAKHTLKYLKGSKFQSLKFEKCKKLKLEGYSDSDWANLEDRRSVTGYCFSLGEQSGCIAWKTRKQQNVALSTCEAEYVALATAVQEAKFLSQLSKDMHIDVQTVIVFVDNQSAIALAKNPVNHQRSKHIDIRYHFIRAEVLNKNVELKYVPTEINIADMYTKPLNRKRLLKLFLGE